jgi:hypothetical protein
MVMKTLILFFKALLIFLLSIIFLNCDILNVKDDCDATIAPEKSVSIMAVIHVRDDNKLPLKGKGWQVTFYKKSCGEKDAHGDIVFQGQTDNQGNFLTTEANYNMRNKNDKVGVFINGTSFARSDVKEYSYDEFIVGYAKVAEFTFVPNP